MLPTHIRSFSPPTGANCPGTNSCGSRDYLYWNVGTINAGQTKTLNFTVPLDGKNGITNLVSSSVVITAPQISDILDNGDFLSGNIDIPLNTDAENPNKTLSAYSYQNNEQTILNLNLPTEANLEVDLIDILGRMINLLPEQYQTEGQIELPLPNYLRQGIYFARIRYNQQIQIQTIHKF